ncbi:HNH endonuclease [Acinetobacter pseudolwoffii]|jgi:5-methylcytosine-specific restriction protein A|uniref:HNH endonuclease n=1 Tax=Acinetobacter pseudolwoffii TaxID=2053287 RepID=A0A2H9YP07_9GAMM|nr:HNH endonuclease [Acinetobacter pseudolwoffii]PJO74360.1 HNH endonuclease [Acinetobacter pseudolwoffii]
MANWLVTVDFDDFELDKAFEALPVIYWKNSTTNKDKGLQLNDIVYVYVTKPISKVMYQFKVIGHADKAEYPIAQKAFWKDTTQLDSIKGYAIFEKLKKVDKASLSYDYFIQQELIPNAPIQGRRTDRDKASNDPIRIFLTHIFNEFKTDSVNTDYPDEANLENSLFPEGAKKIVQVNRYERNPEARAKCIEIHGTRCKICEMSFAETYGAFAKDFIHVHHITSLSEISDSYEVNPETDLIPVCPNCHAMLHRQENGIPMKVDRLKLLFEVSKSSKI